jgi:hypothetical protein
MRTRCRKAPSRSPKPIQLEKIGWYNHLITRSTIAIGTPLYVLYNAEAGNDGGKRGSFKGDIRIAKKLGTKKNNNMFTFKDGSSKAVATTDLKTLIKVSNGILNSAQVSTVFAKKVVQAEGIIDLLDPHQTQLDDSESDSEEGVSGEGEGSSGEEDEDPPGEEEDDAVGDEAIEGAKDNGSGGEAGDVESRETTSSALEDTAPTTCIEGDGGGGLAGVVENNETTDSGRERFPLANPMTPFSQLPPPPQEERSEAMEDNLSEYMIAVHDAQEKMRNAKTQLKRWKVAKLQASGKRAMKKKLEEQLKVVKREVKMEAEVTKQKVQLPPQKRQRGDDSDADDDEGR